MNISKEIWQYSELQILVYWPWLTEVIVLMECKVLKSGRSCNSVLVLYDIAAQSVEALLMMVMLVSMVMMALMEASLVSRATRGKRSLLNLYNCHNFWWCGLSRNCFQIFWWKFSLFPNIVTEIEIISKYSKSQFLQNNFTFIELVHYQGIKIQNRTINCREGCADGCKTNFCRLQDFQVFLMLLIIFSWTIEMMC